MRKVQPPDTHFQVLPILQREVGLVVGQSATNPAVIQFTVGDRSTKFNQDWMLKLAEELHWVAGGMDPYQPETEEWLDPEPMPQPDPDPFTDIESE